jgi:hypothetical protein
MKKIPYFLLKGLSFILLVPAFIAAIPGFILMLLADEVNPLGDFVYPEKEIKKYYDGK